MSKFNGNKMRCIIFIIMCLIPALKAKGSVNYCGSKMCSHTNTHTYCQYPAGPSPACTGHMDARLSTEEKSRVMMRLNRRRREAALGLGAWYSAGDMLKLRWVEELAREAQLWANQCRPPSTPEEQDECRDLYSITVGQCVASVVGEAPGLRPETMVDMWYMQRMQYKGNITVYVPPEEGNNYYADFGQMMWSRSFMVGCGRSRFMTEWRGRVRSVERLVCNFAPRGPADGQPLWRPALAAAACPPRAYPDVDLPGLCTYLPFVTGHTPFNLLKIKTENEMEETRAENNLISLEDQLLLDTVLDIERNKSLDYIGSLDEIYLTRLAVANMENSDSSLSSNNSIQKREIIDTSSANDTSAVKIEFNIATEHLNMSIINIPKKKALLVGRPKSYKVEDLSDPYNDIYTKNFYKIQTTTTTEKDVYGYYEYNDNEDTKSTTLSTAKVSEYLDTDYKTGNFPETTQKFDELMDLNATDITTVIITSKPDTQQFISSGDTTVINDPYTINESSIKENVVDDYLTDPETALQMQEALERMERNLAATPATAGKVRRELRRQNPDHYRARPDLSEIERNKTVDRGPMLSMMLKYMPYLKTYEKSILGGSSSSNTLSHFLIIIYIMLLDYIMFLK